jgi:non-ribosomal peptide synthetase component F
MPRVPALKYRDYVRVEVESRRARELRDFWLNELRDVPHGALPRPSQIGSQSRWSETKVAIDPARYDALVALSGRAGVPVKHAVLAAHLAVIGLLHRQTDVLTAVFVNGRLEEEAGEDVLGLFLNFMPFRQDLRGRTWRQLIEQTFANDRRRLPYRRYPISDLRRDLARGRLVETAFNYTQFKAYAEVARDAGPAAGQLLTGVRWFEHTSFPLLVNAGYDLGLKQMIITLNANAHVLPPWSIELLGELYDATLTHMVAHADAPVTEPSEDMKRLVAAFVDAR